VHLPAQAASLAELVGPDDDVDLAEVLLGAAKSASMALQAVMEFARTVASQV